MFLLATGSTVLRKYESPDKSDRLPTGESSTETTLLLRSGVRFPNESEVQVTWV